MIFRSEVEWEWQAGQGHRGDREGEGSPGTHYTSVQFVYSVAEQQILYGWKSWSGS